MAQEKKTFTAMVASDLETSIMNANPPDPAARGHIIAWEPKDHKELEQLGVPPAPDGFTYIVGAEALEWPIKECRNSHIYLISKNNYLSDLDGECFGNRLQVWRRTPDIRLWLAGFASIDEVSYAEFGPVTKAEEDTGLVVAGGEPFAEDLSGEVHILASLSTAYSRYTNSCDCGDRYADNCAHFISNALIKAGYGMGSGAKCRCGRMIRAKELLNWARSRPGRRFSSGHNSLRSGIWIVYQERSDGQGHILFHSEEPTTYYWKGTGDYHSWPVQWHYSF